MNIIKQLENLSQPIESGSSVNFFTYDGNDIDYAKTYILNYIMDNEIHNIIKYWNSNAESIYIEFMKNEHLYFYVVEKHPFPFSDKDFVEIIKEDRDVVSDLKSLKRLVKFSGRQFVGSDGDFLYSIVEYELL